MAKTKVKEAENVAMVKSQEYVQNSSSESESDSAPSGRQTPQTSKRKTQLNSSKGDEAESDQESSSESTSTASSTSRSSSPAKRKAGTSRADSQPIQKKSKLTQHSSAKSKRKSLVPPSGYSTIQVDASDYMSGSGSMFADLNGKQVWHITAPASVPITSVRTLDIQAALRGEPILQHNGLSYSLFATASKSEALLLPGGFENDYAGSNIDVTRSFHLREIAKQKRLPKDPTNPASDEKVEEAEGDDEVVKDQFFAIVEGEKKPHRQQPAGLLMRYQPYGSLSVGNEAYKLPDPALDADKENESVVYNTLQVPSAVDETPISIVKTPKKSKKGDNSKDGKKSRKHDSPEKQATDVEMLQSDAISEAPRLKSTSKSESEKRRKKQPKAEA